MKHMELALAVSQIAATMAAGKAAQATSYNCKSRDVIDYYLDDAIRVVEATYARIDRLANDGSNRGFWKDAIKDSPDA